MKIDKVEVLRMSPQFKNFAKSLPHPDTHQRSKTIDTRNDILAKDIQEHHEVVSGARTSVSNEGWTKAVSKKQCTGVSDKCFNEVRLASYGFRNKRDVPQSIVSLLKTKLYDLLSSFLRQGNR